MNFLEAYCERHGRGYVAMYRLTHKAQAWPLMHDGEPKIFATKAEALLAGHQRLVAHVNDSIRGSGQRCVSKKKASREELKKLFKDQRPLVSVGKSITL